MPRTRSYRPALHLAATMLCWVLIGGSLACACTIPVFRYALERWESDRFLVIVYHDGQLTAEQDLALSELTQRSSSAGGPLNIEVIRFNVASAAPETARFPELEPPANRPLPWVEIRGREAGGQTRPRWQGSLAEATSQSGPFESPARKEIVQRLLAGDSCVWLLIGPDEQLKGLSERLRAILDGVTDDLSLPKGVGLPGSELYAPIPLEIRFSVLPISHSDAAEQPFLKMLAASAEQWDADQAYAIPVFGRCRALDVFPFAETDERLVEDVGNFLCAACSCRVKQANPGFDLLVSVDWSERLFGAQLPPKAANDSSGLPDGPEFVAIPTGNQPAPGPEQREDVSLEHGRAADDQSSVSNPRETPGGIKALLLLVILTLVGGVLATIFGRR